MEEECSSSSREVSSPSSSYEDEAESDGDDEYEAESGGDSFEEFDGTGGEAGNDDSRAVSVRATTTTPKWRKRPAC